MPAPIGDRAPNSGQILWRPVPCGRRTNRRSPIGVEHRIGLHRLRFGLDVRQLRVNGQLRKDRSRITCVHTHPARRASRLECRQAGRAPEPDLVARAAVDVGVAHPGYHQYGGPVPQTLMSTGFRDRRGRAVSRTSGAEARSGPDLTVEPRPSVRTLRHGDSDDSRECHWAATSVAAASSERHAEGMIHVNRLTSGETRASQGRGCGISTAREGETALLGGDRGVTRDGGARSATR